MRELPGERRREGAAARRWEVEADTWMVRFFLFFFALFFFGGGGAHHVYMHVCLRELLLLFFPPLFCSGWFVASAREYKNIRGSHVHPPHPSPYTLYSCWHTSTPQPPIPPFHPSHSCRHTSTHLKPSPPPLSEPSHSCWHTSTHLTPFHPSHSCWGSAARTWTTRARGHFVTRPSCCARGS
jgi:hypothetical protein